MLKISEFLNIFIVDDNDRSRITIIPVDLYSSMRIIQFSFVDRSSMILQWPFRSGTPRIFSSLWISIHEQVVPWSKERVDISLKIVLRILCATAFLRGHQTNSNTSSFVPFDYTPVNARNRCTRCMECDYLVILASS